MLPQFCRKIAVILKRVFIFCFLISATSYPGGLANDDYDPEMNDTPEPGVQNDYDYDGGEGEDVDDDKSENPVIESKPMEFVVNKFESVLLPCKTSGASKC